MRSFVLLMLAALIACTLAMGEQQQVKRDDMMGFGDISAIDTLGGIGLGKRSMNFDEGKQMLARYLALMRERNAIMLLLLVAPLLLAAVASAKCVDGVDNKLKMHDMFNGKKDVVFEDFVMLTYDNLKRPSCAGKGKGKVVLPGYYKFMSGKIRVKKPSQLVGAVHLGFNLEKNSLFVGSVCQNGKSVNAFVGDELCNVDLFALASPAAFKEFQREGLTDIMDLPGDWAEMKPMIRQDNPYIEGEWKVSVALNMAGSAFAGVKIGDGWIEVSTQDAAQAEKSEL